MKKLKLFLILLCVSLTVAAQKSAILVAQFGTSNDEGRTASLDVILNDIKGHFPQYEVRESYTSPTIRRILAKRGVKKDSTIDALMRLHLDGYDSVYVMPTFLLDGVEMNMLRDDIRSVSSFFSHIKVGTPVLYKISDFQAVADILANEPTGKKDAVMYVGHGNEYASTSAYTMLGEMMQQKGHYFVGTIEGWPDIETSVSMIDKRLYKSVRIVPLLLSCGVHVREDIDGEWRPALEQKGLQVSVTFRGLGELKEIRNLIISHLENLLKAD